MQLALSLVTLFCWAWLVVWLLRSRGVIGDSLSLRYRITAEISAKEGDQDWAVRCYRNMHEAREYGHQKWTDWMQGKPPMWLWALAVMSTVGCASHALLAY